MGIRVDLLVGTAKVSAASLTVLKEWAAQTGS